LAKKLRMSEAGWLAAADPQRMLEHLGRRASARKLRLFAVACWRALRPLLSDTWSLEAIETVEGLAEEPGGTYPDDLDELGDAYYDVESTLATRLWGGPDDRTFLDAVEAGTEGELTRWDPGAARAAATLTAASAAINGGSLLVLSGLDRPPTAAEMTARLAAQVRAVGGRTASAWHEQRRLQAALLRDVFGNPFRPLAPRAFPPHVAGLAEACDEAFPAVGESFAILADALEEVGEAAASAHCREALHVKGCHVVDWVRVVK
jgi:hypothetical protein